jgi:hypothetical protein
MFVGSKARPVLKDDNLATVCEPIVYTMWDPRHLKLYRTPRPATGIAFTYIIDMYYNM